MQVGRANTNEYRRTRIWWNALGNPLIDTFVFLHLVRYLLPWRRWRARNPRKKKLQLRQSRAFSRDLDTPRFSLAVNDNIMQVWSIWGLCSLQSKDLKEVCAVCDSIVWRGWEMRYMTSKYATAFFWNNTVIVRMCDILGTGSDQFIPLNNPNYCLLTSTNCLKVFWIITRDLFSKL